MTEANRSIFETNDVFSTTDIVLLPVQVLITLVGIPGNILVITVVRKNRAMHTSTNFLFLNLAVTDLLTLLWLLPSVGLKCIENPGGSVGLFLCKFITYNSLPLMTAAVSGLTLTLLAIERYNALLKPFRATLRLTKETVGYAIGAVWLFCFAIFLPLAFYVDFDDVRGACVSLMDDRESTIFHAILAVSMVATLMIVIFCYVRIIKGLYFSNTICCASASTSKEEARSKRKVVKLLLIVTGAYLICFAPYMSSVVLFAATGITPVVFYKTVVTLLYCNSSMNALILAFQSGNYREGFKKILSKNCFVKKCIDRYAGLKQTQSAELAITGQPTRRTVMQSNG